MDGNDDTDAFSISSSPLSPPLASNENADIPLARGWPPKITSIRCKTTTKQNTKTHKMKHVVESGDFFFFCVLAWYKDRGDLQSYRGESKTPEEDAEVPVSGVLWLRNIFSLRSRLFLQKQRKQFVLRAARSRRRRRENARKTPQRGKERTNDESEMMIVSLSRSSFS